MVMDAGDYTKSVKPEQADGLTWGVIWFHIENWVRFFAGMAVCYILIGTWNYVSLLRENPIKRQAENLINACVGNSDQNSASCKVEAGGYKFMIYQKEKPKVAEIETDTEKG